MSDLGKLTIWNDPAIRGALSWYLDVAENRRPAKFRIAATIATQCAAPEIIELRMRIRPLNSRPPRSNAAMLSASRQRSRSEDPSGLRRVRWLINI